MAMSEEGTLEAGIVFTDGLPVSDTVAAHLGKIKIRGQADIETGEAACAGNALIIGAVVDGLSEVDEVLQTVNREGLQTTNHKGDIVRIAVILDRKGDHHHGVGRKCVLVHSTARGSHADIFGMAHAPSKGISRVGCDEGEVCDTADILTLVEVGGGSGGHYGRMFCPETETRIEAVRIDPRFGIKSIIYMQKAVGHHIPGVAYRIRIEIVKVLHSHFKATHLCIIIKMIDIGCGIGDGTTYDTATCSHRIGCTCGKDRTHSTVNIVVAHDTARKTTAVHYTIVGTTVEFGNIIVVTDQTTAIDTFRTNITRICTQVDGISGLTITNQSTNIITFSRNTSRIQAIGNPTIVIQPANQTAHMIIIIHSSTRKINMGNALVNFTTSMHITSQTTNIVDSTCNRTTSFTTVNHTVISRSSSKSTEVLVTIYIYIGSTTTHCHTISSTHNTTKITAIQ